MAFWDHVVDGADEVIVTFTDKRELKARIVGSDRMTVVVVDVAGAEQGAGDEATVPRNLWATDVWSSDAMLEEDQR